MMRKQPAQEDSHLWLWPAPGPSGHHSRHTSLGSASSHTDLFRPKGDAGRARSALYRLIFLSACVALVTAPLHALVSLLFVSKAAIETSVLTVFHFAGFLSAIFGSAAVYILGIKVCFVLSSLSILVFVAANVTPLSWICYSASFLAGLGNSLLWIANGAVVARCLRKFESQSLHERGSINGFAAGLSFFLVFFFRFIGLLLLTVFPSAQRDIVAVGAVCSAVLCIGVLFFLYFKTPEIPPPSHTRLIQTRVNRDRDYGSIPGLESVETNIRSRASTASILELIEPEQPIWRNLTHLKDRRIMFMAPIYLFSGLTIAFAALVLDRSVYPLPTALAYSITSALASALSGKISDSSGRKPVILVAVCLQAISFCFIVLWDTRLLVDVTLIFLAVLLGVGNGIFLPQLYAIVLAVYDSAPESAFANVQLFSSLSVGIALAIESSPTRTTEEVWAWVCLIGLLVAMFSGTYLDFFVVKLDPRSKYRSKSFEDNEIPPVEPSPSSSSSSRLSGLFTSKKKGGDSSEELRR